jgi:beta-D-xylosidase 4
MVERKRLAVLVLSALELGLVQAQSCDASGGTTAYHGKYKSLGCYNDSSVSILSDAKVSTIAMTPQYCADFCGARGYEYGGIEFTT